MNSTDGDPAKWGAVVPEYVTTSIGLSKRGGNDLVNLAFHTLQDLGRYLDHREDMQTNTYDQRIWMLLTAVANLYDIEVRKDPDGWVDQLITEFMDIRAEQLEPFKQMSKADRLRTVYDGHSTGPSS